ncbi:transglutaminase-like domain-containing protein [Flavitalea antarctica]
MRTVRIQFILLLITLVLALLNWYARKQLPDSYALQLSYNELYLDPGSLRIKSAKSEENKLAIQLGGSVHKLSSNIPPKNFSDSNSLNFSSVDTGRVFWLHQYGSVDSFRFSINFAPEQLYRSFGNAAKGNFEINSSSLVFSDASLIDHAEWAYDFKNLKQEAQEDKDLQEYLKDSIGIRDSDPGLARLEKIFFHLLPVTSPNLGVPADSVNSKQPLELVGLLKRHRVKVWCGNLSTLLGAMTSAAGLPTRLVTTEGYHSFTYPVHSFNEVYLPEYRLWIYTDLTSGVVYLKTNDRLLNTVEINRMLRAGISGADVKAVTGRDSIDNTPIDSLPPYFTSYFAAPQRFRFYYPRYLREQNLHSPWIRIKRFLQPAYNFAYYSEENHYAANGFWFRSLTGYLLILAIIISVVYFGASILRRR